MGGDPQTLADFRAQIQRARDTHPEAWEASRRLVAPAQAAATLKRLIEAIRNSSLPESLSEELIATLRGAPAGDLHGLSGPALKRYTGLSTTKAVRALCVHFGLAEPAGPAVAGSGLDPASVEQFLRGHRNPYDLLLGDGAPSLLDLGCGDLSFAEELADRYVARLGQQGKTLSLHCMDRLQPGSRFGGPLHAEPRRMVALRTMPGLWFKFWGGQDMCALESVKSLLPRYTLATCHAPANPTFAIEPTRVSPPIIDQHLRATKGQFRIVREHGEPALEVMHGGKALLFPPWKFEVRGPLALLDVLSRRGATAILSSVDMEVFWEVLTQLVADPKVRPKDLVLTPSLVADLFGDLYTKLMALPIGGSAVLSDLAETRQDLPRVLTGPDRGRSYRFRYVEIRRGALFEGLPASQTARQFKNMKAEAPPWMVILVPEA